MFNDELSRQAFAGHLTFLRECALATDCREDEPIIPDKKRPSTHVYFIGPEAGPIKIGKAREPYARLWTLQIGNPEQLYLYAMAEGDYLTERKLHSEFQESRLRGEWFTRSDPILRRIIEWQSAEIHRLQQPDPESASTQSSPTQCDRSAS